MKEENIKMFVLDCSVTMAWCFEEESADASKQVLYLLKNMKAIVPAVWSLEVSNVLRVAERKSRINLADSDSFINMLNKLPIEVDIGLSSMFNKQLIAITRKHHLSSYDAAYLELALRYNVPLATFDSALRQAAQSEGLKLY